MVNPRQIKKLKEGVKAWNEWREENSGEKINLRGANLSGQDLSDANFSGADIQGANFRKAILRNTNFSCSKAGLQRSWFFIIFLSSWLIILGLIFVFLKIIIFVFQETILETRPTIELAIIVSAVIFTEIIVVLIVFAEGFARVVTGDATPAGTLIKFLLFGYIGLLGILVLGQLDQEIITVAEAAEGIFIVIIMLFFVMVISYLTRFILSNFNKDNSIYDWAYYFAISLVCIKDTSFRGADLTDAIFSEAILKGADFRKANLNNVVWLDAKFFDRVRLGKAYLKNDNISQLFITRQVQNKKFDNEELREINLKEELRARRQENTNLITLLLSKMTDQNPSKYDLRGARIVSIIDTAQNGSYQEINQFNYSSEQKQILAQALADIQNLIKQFEQNNPHATEEEKIIYLNYNTTPSFKRRVVSALQSAGETAIEEFFDNSYVNIGKAAIKGWLKPE